MRRRKIGVITGSRAEYGLLYWIIKGINDDPALELQLIVTAAHLSPEFGLTVKDIEKDAFPIAERVEMLLSSDTETSVATSMGLGIMGFAKAYDRLKPDIVLGLGDRFELFSAVAAAMVSRIPVAHLHGGEATEGAFDEAIRNALTKMSHLHFVAAEEYGKRVIQMGEHPERVFMVGGLGVDYISKQKLLDRPELEAALDFKLGQKSLLVTFHPVTLENRTSAGQMAELLAAMEALEDTRLIFTMPNSDTDGRVLFGMIERFVAEHPNARAYTSLGQVRYLSCIRHVDGVVGNSSSGLAEVPSFGKGTVNIGDRQRGRLKAGSVIDCEPDRHSIIAALQRLYSPQFQESLKDVRNPYGEGGASEKIVQIVKTYPLESILKKSFYDIAFGQKD